MSRPGTKRISRYAIAWVSVQRIVLDPGHPPLGLSLAKSLRGRESPKLERKLRGVPSKWKLRRVPESRSSEIWHWQGELILREIIWKWVTAYRMISRFLQDRFITRRLLIGNAKVQRHCPSHATILSAEKGWERGRGTREDVPVDAVSSSRSRVHGLRVDPAPREIGAILDK